MDDDITTIGLVIGAAIVGYVAWKKGYFAKAKVAATNAITTVTGATPVTSSGITTQGSGQTVSTINAQGTGTTSTTSGGVTTTTTTTQTNTSIIATSDDPSDQYWCIFTTNPGTYMGHDIWSDAQPVASIITNQGIPWNLMLPAGTYYFSTTGGYNYAVVVNGVAVGTTTYGTLVTFTVQ